MYRRRTVVERCNNRLKQVRAVATRYDERDCNYRAMLVSAALLSSGSLDDSPDTP